MKATWSRKSNFIFTPAVLRSYQNVILSNDAGAGFRTCIEVLVAMCPKVRSLFGEFHRVEEKNYHVTLCGFSGHFIHCLNEFLHEGQITLALNSNTCDEAIKELKEAFSQLGIPVPESFWHPKPEQKFNPSLYEPVVEVKIETNEEISKPIVTVENNNGETKKVNNGLESPSSPRNYQPRRKLQGDPDFVQLSNVDPSTFPCPMCHKEFSKRTKLNKHVKTIHPEVHNDYQAQEHRCPVCNRTFVTAGFLDRHKRSMTCNFEAVCTICGKMFNNFWTYREHVRTTHKEEEAKCEVCGRIFKNQKYVDKHFSKEHGQKKYCEYCNMEFWNSGKLKHHIWMHHKDDSERPFVCNVCGKGFARKRNFQEHYRIHTNDKPYRCRICDYASNSLGNRNKHERQTHKYVHNEKKLTPPDDDSK